MPRYALTTVIGPDLIAHGAQKSSSASLTSVEVPLASSLQPLQ